MAAEGLLKYPFIFFCGFLTSYLLTPAVAQLAKFLGIVDHPSERRINQRIIPSSGGLAVFIGFHVACAAIFLLPWTPFHGKLTFSWWIHYLLVSTGIIVVGLVDDSVGIRPRWKLLLQIVAALCMYQLDVRVGKVLGMELPALVDMTMTVLWFVVITNAFNLIDGMDGLASGLAIIASLGIAGSFLVGYRPTDALVLIGFAGACAGFLRYNFHPASIFLGDTGSLFIGFTLAAVALSTGAKGTVFASVGVPLLAVGIPIFDAALAVWRRSVRKLLRDTSSATDGGIMHYDMEHLHHRLMSWGLTQPRVALLLYASNVALVSVAMLSLLYRSQAVGIYLLAFVVAAYFIFRHVARIELKESGTAILHGFRRPTHPLVAILLWPALDVLLLATSLGITLYLGRPTTSLMHLKDIWFANLPMFCGATSIALFLSRTYSCVWSRARISEFVFLILALSAGGASGAGLARIVLRDEVRLTNPEGAFFLVLGVLFIVGLRALPQVIADLIGLSATRTPSEQTVSRRILVYGTGNQSRSLLKRLSAAVTNGSDAVSVVGLLDDDPNYRNRTVYGYRVLGGLKDIIVTLQSYDIDGIVIATHLEAAKVETLLRVAKNYSLTVSSWSVREEALYAPSNEADDESRDLAYGNV